MVNEQPYEKSVSIGVESCGFAQLPQGYEPHELPADYTGPLWIEGQLRQFENSVRERDTSLLRQCWDALDELMHSNSTKAAQHKYLAVTDALRERLGDF